MKLSEIMDISVGGTPDTKNNDYWNGSIPWLSVKDFNSCSRYVYTTEKSITQEGLTNSATKLLEKDDLIISARGTVGSLAMIPFSMAYNQSCYGLRAKKEFVSPSYLFYLLKCKVSALLKNSHGSVFDTITIDAFSNIKVELPSKEEQERVSRLLCNIDDKIECNNRINDNLLHQLKCLYDYWFTQFDFPDKNGKPYKSSGGSLQWNSKVKKNIPIGWSVEKVSCCIERIGTGLNPRDNFVLGNGTIRYVTVKNLTTLGTIDFSGCDTIDDSARDLVHKRSDIKIGDILFASIAPLGRCYLIQETPKTWDINESVFAIRPNYQIITSEYLYAFFTSESFVKGATSSSTGSIFKGIRINTLLDSLLIVPPKHILQLYSSMASPLMKKIASNCNEISELTKLRDWLLPMLMNGQASITN